MKVFSRHQQNVVSDAQVLDEIQGTYINAVSRVADGPRPRRNPLE